MGVRVHSLLALEMAVSANPDRVAVQHGDDRITFEALLSAAWQVPGVVGDATAIVYIGPNSLAFPIALFGAAAADVPCIPLNYRLSDEQLLGLLDHHEGAVVVADPEIAPRLAAHGHRVLTIDEFVAATTQGGEPGFSAGDGDEVWLLLYTSGTTAAPKAAILRHRHITSYVIGSVEFAAAEDDDAALVSVPPYHIAGVSNLMSNLYLGRRIVYLDRFDAADWVETVERERITSGMVVPTMLSRICDALEADPDADMSSLAALSYGGARTPSGVVERVMKLLPHTGLTNGYGLTETSSTVALLSPDDHRAAFADPDPAVRARLSSVGKVLPSIEVEIRDEDGTVLPTGEAGEIWLRGDQVSGEYRGQGSVVDADGWFPTRDRGWVDDGDYLFVEGRSDDTIIRGGENIAPAEIEETLREHPAVAEVAVVGVPDDEWGQRIAAVIVPTDESEADPDDITSFVRGRLRTSKTPDIVRFVDELPYTETGKLLRRVVLADLEADRSSDDAA
jgi:acyl-CoA synthetase (AMP-forming)/AMP-acid ligase II